MFVLDEVLEGGLKRYGMCTGKCQNVRHFHSEERGWTITIG